MIMGILQFIPIFLMMIFPESLADFIAFRIHEAYSGVYCADHADRLSTVSSSLMCGVRCSNTEECRGFFYNNGTGVCTPVKIISVPQTGCLPETGSNYYIMLVDGMFDCYKYTVGDYAMLSGGETDYEVCTRGSRYRAYYTDVGTSKHYGCGTCWCCKTKGCYSSKPNQYNGTWSKTVSGLECQRWDQQTPHAHDRWQANYVYPPGETYVTAENYCRDPDGDWNEVWCYTTDPAKRWESCGIPKC